MSTTHVKVVIEKHPDGYVAYPLGLKGVIVSQGQTYDDVLRDLRSAIRFHIETFGPVVFEDTEPHLEACHGRYAMLKTVQGIIREGKIELLEQVELPEGANVLVTFLPDEAGEFWLNASQVSLDAIWDNPEDDVYGKLLEE